MIRTKFPVFGLIIITIVLISINQSFAYSQLEENARPDNDIDVQRISSPPQSDLNITSATSYFDGDYFYIVGEVLNSASNTKEFVKVVSTLYDDNSDVIGTDYTYTDPSTIPSSNSAPFKLMIGEGDVRSIESIKKYKIVASNG
jgi:hypothetical protein